MKICPFLSFNFGNRKIDNFSKMDLVLAILHGETLEQFALRHNCSIGTVKRRKKEWGIVLQKKPEYRSRIEIPLKDLVSSNNPDIPPERICVDNNCSKPTLERRKKDYHVPRRVPKFTPNLTADDFSSIYSGDLKVKDYLEQNKGKMSSSTYYRKLAKSNFPTSRKQSRALSQNIDKDFVDTMLILGKSYKDIADFYHVSERTLMRHLQK